MGPIQSLADLLDMLRRRAGVILSVTLLGCVGSVFAVLQRDHQYQSIEVIQITQPVVADQPTDPTADDASARRLQLIEQRLMARDTLLDVAAEYGLFDDAPKMRDSTKVTNMREAVQMLGVAAAGTSEQTDGATISVLTITATMPTPELAQQIAREFGQRTIDLTNEDRILQARDTLAFFDARAQGVNEEIADIEAEQAAFRTANEIALPESLEFRRAEIGTINEGLLEIARERIDIEREMELADNNNRAATAARIRERLQENLATLEAQFGLLTARKDELERLVETGPQVEQQLNVYNLRLQQLQTQLDDITARRSEAETGFKLESERQAERLMVIEEAALPDYPVSVSRKLLALLGGFASLCLGLFAALVLELRNPVIRSSAQLERELGFKPAATVPVLDTDGKRNPRSSGA